MNSLDKIILDRHLFFDTIDHDKFIIRENYLLFRCEDVINIYQKIQTYKYKYIGFISQESSQLEIIQSDSFEAMLMQPYQIIYARDDAGEPVPLQCQEGSVDEYYNIKQVVINVFKDDVYRSASQCVPHSASRSASEELTDYIIDSLINGNLDHKCDWLQIIDLTYEKAIVKCDEDCVDIMDKLFTRQEDDTYIIDLIC